MSLILVPTAVSDQVRFPSDGNSTLSTLLAFWRRRLLRFRALVLLRRWLIVGIVCAGLITLASRFLTVVPGWAALVIPLVLVGGALAVLLYAAPLPAAIARLIDRRLGLQEQVASALEVTQRQHAGRSGPLDARLEASASTALSQAGSAWRLRSAQAIWEWLGLLCAVALVALALQVPRFTASAASGAPVASRPLAYANAMPQSTTALLAVPTMVAQQPDHPVTMSIAVIRTPAPAPPLSVPRSRRHIQAPSRLVIGRASGAASQPNAKNGAAPQANRSTGGAGAVSHAVSPHIGSSPLQPRAVQQSKTLPVLSNRHLFLPTKQSGQASAAGQSAPPGANAPNQATGPSGKSGGVATRSLDSHGNQQTRRGANGAVGMRGGAGSTGGTKIGGVGQGQTRSPYGSGMPLIGALPKPGLITGKSSFSGRSIDGKSTAGSGQGSSQHALGSSLSLQLTQGHQLTLQSAYGANRAGQSNRVPGTSGADNGHTATASGATGDSAGTIDYIPSDANSVAPSDRAIVSTYFMPASNQ